MDLNVLLVEDDPADMAQFLRIFLRSLSGMT